MTRTELIQALRSTHASNETICHVMHLWRAPVEGIQLPTFFYSCCKAVGADLEYARSKNRSRRNTRARFLFCYYLREHYRHDYTLKEIGDFLSGRDHTTVINGCITFKALLETGDEVSQMDIDNLKRVLHGDEPIFIEVAKREYEQKQKYIKLFFEKRTDRYFYNIKSIRSFYGFGHHVLLNKSRFVKKTFPVAKINEIDLF